MRSHETEHARHLCRDDAMSSARRRPSVSSAGTGRGLIAGAFPMSTGRRGAPVREADPMVTLDSLLTADAPMPSRDSLAALDALDDAAGPLDGYGADDRPDLSAQFARWCERRTFETVTQFGIGDGSAS